MERSLEHMVVGNCHIHQIASSLELMVEATTHVLRDPSQKMAEAEVARSRALLGSVDKIGVISTFWDDFVGLFPECRDRSLMIPHVRCHAFHPDIMKFSVGGKRQETRMEMSHSRLILFGFMNGLSPRQTRDLFNARNYRILGYHDRWERDLDWARYQSELTGWDVVPLYEKWRRAGCFVNSPNHPKLSVLGDLAHGFAKKAGLEILMPDARDLQIDRSASHAIWPVYPELAEGFGFDGSLRFKVNTRGQNLLRDRSTTIGLEEFIDSCFSLYSALPVEDLPRDRFSGAAWEQVLELSSRVSAGASTGGMAGGMAGAKEVNPYRNLPDSHYWKRSISHQPMAEVDPVAKAKFRISSQDRVSTAGSCFAQHISNTLAKSGCNYFVAEQAPREMSPGEGVARNYGTFSARFGNVYTTRQMLQLFERAYGTFTPELDHLIGNGGEYLDPWRPLIQPGGFRDPEALATDRQEHLAAVRRMFEESDVLVFTLGLTEGWKTKSDGSVLPVVPGAVTGWVDPDDFFFFNMTAGEVTADLEELWAKLKSVNPRLRMVLTVSPVPLIATYDDRHVLAATTYSKSVLRVAADHMDRAYPDIMYFPSYEIITGNFNRGAYFEDDLRGVKREGVDHVMRLFMKHCVISPAASDLSEQLAEARIVCDEEVLD